MLLFASAKSNQKARGVNALRPRFKTRTVGFQAEFESFSALRFFAKVYQCHKTHGHVLNRCERAISDETQNRFLWKIEVAVRAYRRKQSMKRDSARYLCCGGKGKLVCADRKFSAKMQFTCVCETQNFAILHQTFRFLRKLLSVPQKVKFSPNQPIL